MGNEIDNSLDPAKLTCIDCGYRLRGLDPQGPCPECGIPIARSLQCHRLAGANVDWLARLSRGQAFIAIGLHVLVWAAVLFVIFAIAFPFILIVVRNVPGVLVMVAFMSVGGAMLAALVACTIGSLFVTVPDPRDSLRETNLSPRSLARWGMLSAVLISSLYVFLGTLFPLSSQFLFGASMLLLGAALTIGVTATLTHLSGLAPQVPDHILLKDTQALIRKMRVLLPLMFVLMSIGPI